MTTIASVLAEVYGAQAAAEITPAFEDLVATHADRPTSAPVSGPHRAWLIAYPDHITDDRRAPLAVLGSFADDHLPAAVNAIHVLPCYPSSSDEGFSVMDYLEIDPAFGAWSDIESMASERSVMLDAVVNHASAQGRWFAEWREGEPTRSGFFRTEDPETDLSQVVRARQHPLLTPVDTASGKQWVWTTFSADQVDLDYGNPHVAHAIADVVLTYARHGASAIRLDAVGFLWKDASSPSINLRQTHLIVQLLRACLDATYPDVVLVTETNVPHEENMSYLGDGTEREADMVYQFPLPPLTLHAFTVADASTLRTWLRSIDAAPGHAGFFNFLSSHDGVGLRPLEGLVSEPGVRRLVDVCRANGGGISTRLGPDGRRAPYELNATWFDLIRGDTEGRDAIQRHLASHALMFALRGEPAVYLQSFLAESNATGLVSSMSSERAINRRRFSLGELEEALTVEDSHAAQSIAGIGRLLEWRSQSRAFDPDSGQRVLDTTNDVVGIERTSPDGEQARVYVNVTPSTVRIDDHGGRVEGFRVTVTDEAMDLGPWGVAWILPETG